jgi:hypothetical protein
MTRLGAETSFSILSCSVRVRAEAGELIELIERVYGAHDRSMAEDDADVLIEIESRSSCAFVVESGDLRREVSGLAGLVWAVGDCLTLSLQRLRYDLLFFHAAALERRGVGLLLVAQSGGGKSTTTWGLLHHGFSVVSDELAPLAPDGRILPYPRALGFKERPPRYPLPESCLSTPPGGYLPLLELPSPARTTPVDPAVLIFLGYRPDSGPSVESVGAAEASALLYGCALNSLAHPGAGVDPCIALARRCRSFRVTTADLEASCELIQETFDVAVESGAA